MQEVIVYVIVALAAWAIFKRYASQGLLPMLFEKNSYARKGLLPESSRTHECASICDNCEGCTPDVSASTNRILFIPIEREK